MSPELLRAIAQGGAGVIAVAVLIAIVGARDVPLWVFGSYYRETVQRLNVDIALLRNELRAERELNQRLLGVTETAVKRAKSPTSRTTVTREVGP
jgi:hypothetical protein